MEKYFFMRSLLSMLAEPHKLNRVLAITLRVLATLIVPFSLVSFFKAGKVIFDLPASGILGGIFFQVFFVLAIYVVVHVLFLRARHIDALPGGDYNIFALSSVLIRAAGEGFAGFISLVSVGGGIYVWFTGKGVGTILNPSPGFLPLIGGTTFIGGIENMVVGVLSAILMIVGTYLIADFLLLIKDTAVRLLTTRTLSQDRPVSGESSSLNETGMRLRSGTGNN